MPGPARTEVLIYAKNVQAVSSFYVQVLGANVVHTDAEHTILQSPLKFLRWRATSRRSSHSLPLQTLYRRSAW